jgi:branched-chain amino acid transport system ATP-binding protein
VDAGKKKVRAMFPQLTERAANMARQLSGGEQQMLAIGRALMTNQRLLVLDEATEGLRPRSARKSCTASRHSNRPASRSSSSTTRSLIEIADRHHVIERGHITWSGPSREPAAPDVQRRYLGI